MLTSKWALFEGTSKPNEARSTKKAMVLVLYCHDYTKIKGKTGKIYYFNALFDK